MDCATGIGKKDCTKKEGKVSTKQHAVQYSGVANSILSTLANLV
jgi:hypothetical protein